MVYIENHQILIDELSNKIVNINFFNIIDDLYSYGIRSKIKIILLFLIFVKSN